MKVTKIVYIPLLCALSLSIVGCGSDTSEKNPSKKTSSTSSAPAPHPYADSLDHRAFEKKSADMCINQELALRKKEHPTSGNAGSADEALITLCNCIAQEESKHLTKQEAKKFVEQNEFPMSLMIKQGQAEEICTKK